MPNGNFDDIFPQVGGTLHDGEHAEPLADEKIENDTKRMRCLLVSVVKIYQP